MKTYDSHIPIFRPGLLIMILSLLVVIPSCKYDYYVEPVINITDTVSFSHDVVPIFNTNCSVSGCHNTGGISPDLSPTYAYDNLYLYEVIDTANPETSVIYERMTSTTKPMPPTGLLQPLDRAKVLAWIKQGGINN